MDFSREAYHWNLIKQKMKVFFFLLAFYLFLDVENVKRVLLTLLEDFTVFHFFYQPFSLYQRG